MGGTLELADREPPGANFVLTLPAAALISGLAYAAMAPFA